MVKMKQKNKLLIFSVIFIITNILFATLNISADCVTSPYPKGRGGHSMAYDTVNYLIIVYGGFTYSKILLNPIEYMKNDTLAYDYNNNEWIGAFSSINSDFFVEKEIRLQIFVFKKERLC